MHPQRQPRPADLGFGRLFDQIRDAVVVSDGDGSIVAWNPAAVKMFGYSVDEAEGRDVNIIVPERLRARHDAGMRRFRESGRGPLLDGGAILELPALRKDGREITVELRLSRLDTGGAPLVMAIVRDVSDRVKLAAAVEADRARLRDANDALQAFSYVVGHDLKEPVRAVNAYLEMLEEHVTSDEGREDLRRAREANTRLHLLLSGLLDWSRAALGEADLVPLQLEEVIRGSACASRYQQALHERRAKLDFEGAFPAVRATEPLLCQVFGNLILNAIRHNPSEHPHVWLVARPEEAGYLPVIVRDNGPGFPPHVVSRFSDPRQRRAPSDRGGFGLAIAVRAVEALGGRIELGVGPSGGGEARVWLRLAEDGGRSGV